MNLSGLRSSQRAVGIAFVLGTAAMSLAITVVVILVAGANPIAVLEKTVQGIGLLSDGVDLGRLAGVINFWIPLTLASIGLLLTFSAGLWNIGVEGQMMFGAICATGVALNLDLPAYELVPLELLVGALGGALWGALAGVLKTKGGVHEIFGGVALNSLASIFTIFLISGPWSNEGGQATPPFRPNALLSASFEDFPVSMTALGLVTVSFVVVFVIQRGTRWGLELKATGKSPRSALLLGVPTNRNAILAMMACGALAGLGGTFRVLFTYGNLRPLVSGGIGFLALLVVLLTGTRVLWVPLISIFFAAILAGSTRVKIALGLDQSLAGVIQGVVVLLVILANGLRGRLTGASAVSEVPAQAEEEAADG